jgi:hypothetical protein
VNGSEVNLFESDPLDLGSQGLDPEPAGPGGARGGAGKEARSWPPRGGAGGVPDVTLVDDDDDDEAPGVADPAAAETHKSAGRSAGPRAVLTQGGATHTHWESGVESSEGRGAGRGPVPTPRGGTQIRWESSGGGGLAAGRAFVAQGQGHGQGTTSRWRTRAGGMLIERTPKGFPLTATGATTSGTLWNPRTGMAPPPPITATAPSGRPLAAPALRAGRGSSISVRAFPRTPGRAAAPGRMHPGPAARGTAPGRLRSCAREGAGAGVRGGAVGRGRGSARMTTAGALGWAGAREACMPSSPRATTRISNGDELFTWRADGEAERPMCTTWWRSWSRCLLQHTWRRWGMGHFSYVVQKNRTKSAQIYASIFRVFSSVFFPVFFLSLPRPFPVFPLAGGKGGFPNGTSRRLKSGVF